MSNEDMENLNEAPASTTVKIKSKNGFEYLFTLRETNGIKLLDKMELLELELTDRGYTALSQGSKYPAKEKEYVPNRKCPTCGAGLVYSQKKDGTKFIKCETNKWNAMTKQSEGCSFVEWNNSTPLSNSPMDA